MKQVYVKSTFCASFWVWNVVSYHGFLAGNLTNFWHLCEIILLIILYLFGCVQKRVAKLRFIFCLCKFFWKNLFIKVLSCFSCIVLNKCFLLCVICAGGRFCRCLFVFLIILSIFAVQPWLLGIIFPFHCSLNSYWILYIPYKAALSGIGKLNTFHLRAVSGS